MSFHAPNSDVAPATLMQRMSRELGQCRTHLQQVEQVLAEALGRPMPLDRASATGTDDSSAVRPVTGVRALQAMDLVMQILGDLEGCLDRLAAAQSLRQADPADAHAILGPLLLADLQRRLAGLAPPGQPATPMELFR